MNLILFEKPFEQLRLEPGDPRGLHIRKVLRAEIGTKVFIGFVNGLRARAEVSALGEDGSLELMVVATEEAPKPLPIQLLLGLPRPHTAKRILFEAASMGVQALHFFEAERSEPSYAKSSLWTTDEWKERLWLGAEQSFGTHLPEVSMHPDLQFAISHLENAAPPRSVKPTTPPPQGGECKSSSPVKGRSSARQMGGAIRIALDNYEASAPLNEALSSDSKSAVLALGPERGWSPVERDIFRKNGWQLAHLGPHVLRAETACTAAVASAASQLGCWSTQTKTEI